MDKGKICGFCRLGKGAFNEYGKFHTQKLGDGKILAAHHKCLQYSAKLVQYKFKHFGGFKIDKVKNEICRGKHMKCFICKTKKKKITSGATAGCAVTNCKKTFHFPCAHDSRVCITKRITLKKRSTVLYRVFCSDDHMKMYTQDYITDKLEDAIQSNSSSSDEDENEDEDEDEDEESKNQNEIKIKKVKNHSDNKHSPAKNEDLLNVSIGKPKSNYKLMKAQTKAYEKNYQNILTPEQKSKRDMVNGTDTKASDFGPSGGENDFELNNLGQEVSEKGLSIQQCADKEKIVDKDKDMEKNRIPTIKNWPISEIGDRVDSIKNPEVVHIFDSEDGEVVITDDTRKDIQDDISDKDVSPTLTEKQTDEESDSTEDFNTSNDACSHSHGRSTDDEFSDAPASPVRPEFDHSSSQILDDWFDGAFLDTCLAICKKTFSEEKENLIRSEITCHFGTSEIVFWQDLPAAHECNGDALTFFMRDLSQMILDKRFKGLADLVLHPEKPASINRYSMELYAAFDLKVRKAMEKAVFTVVKDNLAKASQEHNIALGDLLPISNEYVMVIVLNNVTDAHYYLRSEFSIKSLVLWDHRTLVNTQLCNICSSLDHFKRKEFIIIRSMFLKLIGSSYRAIFIPQHQYFLDKNKMSISLARKLGDMISHAETSEEDESGFNTLVLCLGGVDTDVVKFKALCHKVFNDCITNLRNSIENIVAILDINACDGFVSEQDIIPNKLLDGCDLFVYSAFKPDVRPISCVLIDVRMEELQQGTDESTMKEVDERGDGYPKSASSGQSQTQLTRVHPFKSTVVNRKTYSDAESCSSSDSYRSRSILLGEKTAKHHYIADDQKPSTSMSGISRKRKRVSEDQSCIT